jgi:hypothetical protein
MGIFAVPSDDIKISLRFIPSDDGAQILDDDIVQTNEAEEVEEADFFFRVPKWGDTRKIMSAASAVREDGMVLDPYKFIDARIKFLLKDWTLTDEKGKKVPVNEQTIERLPPHVVNYLHRKLDENPLVAKAFGTSQTQV